VIFKRPVFGGIATAALTPMDLSSICRPIRYYLPPKLDGSSERASFQHDALFLKDSVASPRRDGLFVDGRLHRGDLRRFASSARPSRGVVRVFRQRE
jgi:hypothetical protein